MKLIWHQNPDEAVQRKCWELEKSRKEGGQELYWALVREVLKTDPWFLMRVALEWGWLDDQLVGNKLVRHVSENWGKDIGVLYPRGHGKTLPMCAITICAILNNPDIAILEISRTEGNSEKIGAFIGEQLMGNDYLQRCFGRKYNEDGFLPSSTAECKQWGKDGYSLPWRKPRIDPTLTCIPLGGAKAGKHPDIIWIDDPTEKENNDELGWNKVKEAVQGCWFLLPANGFMWWTGTRWHDADPLGMAEKGKLNGKQGMFHFIKESCYVDDNPLKDPTYPAKKRWNMDQISGYTKGSLEAQRRPEPEGLGEFFDAQMRNDPIPAERADIKVKDINIYKPEELPKTTEVLWMGIEVTGGGLPIFNAFKEYLEQTKENIPIVEIRNPRQIGVQKKDRIISALQPIVDRGALWAQEWMLGDEYSSEGLGYEIRRLGKATHDDIVDALHNIPVHLVKQIYPSHPDDLADLYIHVDLAWSESQRSDWTVAIAVAVDHRQNYWIVDYDRFKISSPTGLIQRLIQFYKKFEPSQKGPRFRSSNKYPGSWR